MNDFTKEELKEMLLVFNELFAESSQPESTHKLKIKIESMIENYCEHEWKSGEHLFTDIYCIKCKRLLNDNK